jgi:hypothetical protein
MCDDSEERDLDINNHAIDLIKIVVKAERVYKRQTLATDVLERRYQESLLKKEAANSAFEKAQADLSSFLEAAKDDSDEGKQGNAFEDYGEKDKSDEISAEEQTIFRMTGDCATTECTDKRLMDKSVFLRQIESMDTTGHCCKCSIEKRKFSDAGRDGDSCG